MFTEDQVSALLEFPEVRQKVEDLKQDFKDNELPLLDISNHDFLSLALLTPTIDLALANGNISLMEEMAINQKARKMSKGGYFLQTDPVVYTLKYLIKKFDYWHDKFYGFVIFLLNKTSNVEHLKYVEDMEREVSEFEFERNLLHSPYILIQYMSTFFINDIEQITVPKKISQLEYEKILEIGRKLEIDKYVIFKGFCQTFTVK